MQVVRKADGFATEVSLEKLVLERPSIIHLRIAPEDVAKFERRGNDLALVLKDGSTVVVQGFFTEYPDDGRNDLVLEDDAGVLWWGQHVTPWSEFHFTEVEWLDGVPAAAAGGVPDWLIAGLALLGVGAAAAGGGGRGGGIGFVPPVVSPPAPPPNQAPTGEVKAVTVRDGEVSQGQVVGRDGDGDVLQFVVSGAPAHGTVTINPATGAFTYTPQPGYTGADSFDVTLSDGRGGIVTLRVPVTVEPAPTQENQGPTASAPALSVDEDTPGRGRVDGQDPDGDSVRYELSQPPAHGTVTLDPDTGEYVYTPAPNYNGDDSFDVTVGDGKGGTVTVTVPVTVAPINDAPVATASPVSTGEDEAVAGRVDGGDVDGDTLGYSLSKPPMHGTVSIVPLTGQYTYTPAPNYNGTDRFEVTVSDGKGGSVTVSVPVTVTPVNDAPMANAPALSTDVNVPVAGRVTASDPDGDVLSYAVARPPAHGALVLDLETGAYTYTPANGYSGSDSFQLVVSDGKGGAATVNVPVTVDAAPQPVNQNPSATAPALTTAEDSPISGKVTGSDPDGDALTYTLGQPPAHGVVNIDPATGTYTYTPAGNYHGSDSFSVVVSDGRGGSVTVGVPVTVAPVNDAPVAPNQNLTVAEDTSLSGQVGGSDFDGDALSYTLNTGPVNGSVTLNPATGQFSYTPSTNFHGADSFIVTVSDGRGGTVNSTITIGVTPVNDAPTTANQALTTPEDVALGGQIQALDMDGDALSYTLSTAPQHGSLTLNPATGQFVYTPAANYNSSDSFVVTVSDGKGGVVASTVTVGVTPANDAPVTADQSLSVDANTPLGGQVVASDVDGDVLGYGVLTAPMNGTLVLNPATGQFTYTPNNGYVGTDSFEVRVSDGQGGMTVSTITLGVGLDNESPVANADTISVAEGGTSTVLVGGATSVLANDTDTENAPLTAILVSGPANGTLTLNANGTFSYTHNGSETTTDSFTYKVNDGTVDGNTVTVSINVAPGNDAPTGTALPVTGQEDQPINGTVVGADVDGNTLSYAVTTPAASGTVTIDPATGAYTYTPNANFNGSDTFTVTISDGQGGTVQVPAAVTVNAVNDAPVAVSDSLTVMEGGTATVLLGGATNVLANDSDVDGDTLTAAIVSGPAHGTLTLNADGTFSYTHDGSETTSDSFTYRVNDGTADGNTVTVSITVGEVNNAPVAVDEAVTVVEDTTYSSTVSLIANDTDTDGPSLSAIAGTFTTAQGGTIVIAADGSYTYTPAANFNGTDTVTYTVTDGFSTDVGTLTLTANPVNDAPRGTAAPVTGQEDQPVDGQVVGTDVDGDTLSYSVTTPAANGTVTIDPATGGYTYTPAAHFAGSDTFTVTISDGKGGTVQVPVNVTVSPVNDAPTGTAAPAVTNEDQPVNGSVMGSDVDGDTLSYAVTTPAANGTVTLEPATGAYTYTPNANFNGSDTFTMTISDGMGGTVQVPVSVMVNAVNDAPTGTAAPVSGQEDLPVSGTVVGNDIDGDTLSYAVTTAATHGTVTVDPSTGTYTYTPNANFHGSDTFTVSISDGQGSTVQVPVSVTVNPVNDAPIAVVDSIAVAEGGTTTILVGNATSVLANDSDVDGDALTAILVSGPAHGTLVLNADGTLSYTHDGSETTSDSFTYKVNDSTVDGNTVTVAISVGEVNNAPVAVDDAVTVDEDTVFSSTVSLIANDTDSDSANLSAVAGTFATTQGGILVMAADGSYTYTPPENFNGVDTVSYTVTDGFSTDVGTLTITVSSVNDAPTGTAAPVAGQEDQPVSGTVVGSDVDGDTLSCAVTTPAANGTVTIDPPTGAYTYTPNANFSGSDTFTVTISDGQGGTVQVPVNVTVNAVNDAPTGTAAPATTNEDQPVNGTVVGADVDGGTLSYAVTTAATNGTVTIDPVSGAYTYTPNANFSGSDTFAVTISDGQGGTVQVPVSVTVSAVNDAPTGTAAPASTNEDQPVNGTVVGSDADGDTLSYAVTTPAANGTVTVDPATGTYTYTPNANFNGNDTFTVTISDGQGGTVQVPVSVTVNPVNDATTGTAAPAVTNEDQAVNGTVVGTDVDGDTLSYAVTTPAASGTVTIDPATGAYTYTPNANFNGNDTFTVTISDGQGGTVQVPISVTVNAVNDAPMAVGDSLTVMEGGTATVLLGGATSVLANDSDVDGDTLTAVIVSGPVHGTLTLNADGTFSYTHDGSETTSDSFTYKVNDGTVDGNTVTVSITVGEVNNAPVAVDEAVTVVEDTTYSSTVSLIANDTDTDGPSLSAIAGTFTTAQGGTIVIAADGSYTYTPAANFNGTDTVTYTVTDGFSTDVGTLTLTVGSVNDAPAGADKTVTINEDTTYTFSAADFALTDANDTPSNALQSVIISTLPAAGQGQLLLNGVAVTAGQSIAVANIGQLTDVPAANANGNGLGAFTFQVVDNGGAASGGQNTDQSPNNFNFNVTPVNDAPTGTAAPVTGQEDQPVNGTVVGADVDGDTLSYAVTTAATNGTVTIDPVTGAYTYTPNANFSGSDTFAVTISDGQGGTVQVPVSVTVNAVNDAPTGTAAPAVTNEDQAVNGTVVGADVDGDTLNYSVTTLATNGTVTVDPATGAYTYTPNANFNGSDTFTVTISDGQGGTVQVPVSVTVNPVNDAPTGTGAPAVTNEDQAVNGTVVGTDVDGDTLSYAVTTAATNGTVTIDPATGAYTYTPNANFSGSDTFTVTIFDGQGGTVQVPVSVTVNAVNDAPTGTVAPATTNEDQPVNGTVVGTDVDGDTLSYAVTTPAASGTVTLDPGTGAYTYTPNANFGGSDTFTVTISDGQGGTVQVPVSVTVNPVNDAPTGAAAPAVTNEDQPVSGTVVGADVDGDTLSYAVTTPAASGTVTIDPATGTYAYTPNTNFNGSDTFTVTISDSQGGTVQLPVSVTVNPVNDAPTGTAAAATTNEDQPVNGTVTSADVDGETLSYAVTTQATNGTVTIDPATGAYTYTPALNFNGTDAFTVTISDGQGGTVQVPVSVTVNAVNDAPTGTAAPATTNEDQPVNGTVAGTDVDGDTLSYAITTAATSGTVTIDLVTGAYTYTPNANFNGSDTFTVTVSDGQGGTVQVPVSVTINAVNDAPTGTAASVSTNEDQAVSGTVVGTDVDGDTLSYAVTTAAANGAVTIDPATGAYAYTPNANFNGSDAFTVTISDGKGGTVQVPVSVTVNAINDAPAGVDKTVTINEDTTYTFTAADFPFTDANDTPSNALQSVIISTLPAAGQGQLLLNGVAVTAGQNIAVANLSQLTYVPAANANGSGLGSFTFQVVDNGGTANGGQNTDQSPSAFSFNVNPVNDAPTGTAAPATTNEDQPVNGTVAGTDVDGDTLSYAVTTQATNGTVTIDPATGAYMYTPTANFNGSDTFTVTISDGQGSTVQVPVSVTINPVNDAPVNMVPGPQSVAEDTPLAIGGISVNDVDGNLATTQLSVLNGSLTVSLAGGATISAGANGSGTLTLVGTQTQINAALAALSYQGAANYNGSDTLTVRSTDSAGLPLSDVDTVAIIVTPVNDTPLAVADSFTVAEGGTATTLDGGAQSVLFNDSDVDGDTLTAILVTGPVNGTLVLNANGTFSYTHNGSETTSDSFSYKVNDGTVDGNTVTVAITVTEVDNAPVAVDDLVTVLEDTPYTSSVSLLANDTDVDGPSLSAVAGTFTTSQGGTIVIAADGSYSYTPPANFDGNDTVTYTVTDGTSSDTGTLTIAVQPINDAPAGADKTVTINEDGAYTFNAADFGLTDANDTPANTLQSVIITTLPAAGQGQLLLNGGAVAAGQSIAVANIGQLTYVPAANANGNAVGGFTFQVADNGGAANGGQNTDQSPNTFSFNVTPVNDAPTGTAAPATTNEDQPVNGTVVGADVDGDTLSYAVTTAATSGTVTIDPVTGAYTYTPNANFNGGDTFTVTISDGKGGTVQVPVSVTVNAVNDAPAGVDKTVTINEDAAYTFTAADFAFTDTNDAPANALQLLIITTLPSVGQGQLLLNGVAVTAGQTILAANLGQLTYVPAANANGSGLGAFTFQVVDTGGILNGGQNTDQSANSFNFNVTPVNDAPAGIDKTVTINEDATYTFTAADFAFTDANDTPANALQSVIISTLPASGQGQLLLNGVAVTAGQVIATASIGQLTYVPAANANGNGLGGFTFQVVDNGGVVNGGQNTDQSPNSFNFNVTPVNDAPINALPVGGFTTNEDISVSLAGLSVTDVDAGTSLIRVTLSVASGQGSLTATGVTGVTVTGNNTNALQLEGTVTAINAFLGGTSRPSYVPVANANGSVTLTMTTTDLGNTGSGGALTDTDTVNITINAVNDAPSGVDKTVTINEDTSYTFTAADFAFTDANDTPANGLQSVIISTLPAAGHGQLLLNGVTVAAGQTVLVANLGQLTYVPAANVNGNALGGFTFQVVDNGGVANGGQNTDPSPNSFNFNVTPVNGAPVGVADNYSAVEGSTTLRTSVLANDTDVDNPASALSASQFANNAAGTGAVAANGVTAITTTLGGTVVMNADGTFTYSAPVRNHADAISDVDSFFYRVSDGNLNSGWTQVNLSITDTVPVANNDVDSVGIGGSISGNVISGAGGNAAGGADTFVDAVTVTLVSHNGATYAVGAPINTNDGTLVLRSDGSYDYTSSYRNINVQREGNAAKTIDQWKAAPGGVANIYGYDGTSPLLSNGNLSLSFGTAASIVRLRDQGNAFDDDGLGVETSAGASNTNNKVQNGEFIVFDLGQVSNKAVVTLTNVTSNTEVGRISWYAFAEDGAQVGTGSISSGGASVVRSGDVATVTLPPALNYKYLAFTVGDADFRVNGLKAEPVISDGNDVFAYTLTDADGSMANANLTIGTSAQPSANNDLARVYESGLNANGSQPAGTQAGSSAAPTLVVGNLFANDGGISPTTTITGITLTNGVNPSTTISGGVITVTDAHGVLKVTAATGAYEYTLNAATTEGVNDVKAFNYVVTDSFNGTTSNATLTVSITDDAPIGADVMRTLEASPSAATYNLVIVLDVSGSMAMDASGDYSNAGAAFDPATVRLQIAKEALAKLVERYDGLGNVNVKIVDFSSTAKSSSWFIDDVTGAIHYIGSQQATGGTSYTNALTETINNLGTPPAADKTLFYFVSDGQPDSGQEVSATQQAAWQNFVTNTGPGSIAFAIGIGSAGLTTLQPVAFPNTANGLNEPYAIKVDNPSDLLNTLLSTVASGIVAGNVSILTGGGSSGMMLGADGGAVTSVTVDGVVYTSAGGTEQTILTNKGGELTVNFATGSYSYQLQVQKSIQGEQEVFLVTATDSDGDAKSINLRITLDYQANLDANRDTILTNVQSGQAITLDGAALVQNDASGGGAVVTSTGGGVNGTVSGTTSITFTPMASGIPAQAIQIVAESQYTSGGSQFNNDSSNSPKNGALQTAIDFTDRTQFGTTGTSGTGWAVDGGIAGYTQVLRGAFTNSNNAGRDQDLIKVYMYAGERLYVDVDGTTGTNAAPGVTVNRAVLDSTGASLQSGAADAWFTASATGEYYIRLQTDAADNDTNNGYNLVLTLDNGASTLGGSGVAPRGPVGSASGHFDYTITEDGVTSSAKADVFHVAGNTITGSGIDEILIGGSGNDILNGMGGNDVLMGGNGDDQLFGSDGADRLEGGAGNDALIGGSGNDILIGGTGNDTLTGGTNADIFRWLAGDGGNDFVTDFMTGVDKIDLRDMLAVVPDYQITITQGGGNSVLTVTNDAGSTLTTITVNGATSLGTDVQSWISGGHLQVPGSAALGILAWDDVMGISSTSSSSARSSAMSTLQDNSISEAVVGDSESASYSPPVVNSLEDDLLHHMGSQY